jgi:dienelactone hydrolase
MMHGLIRNAMVMLTAWCCVAAVTPQQEREWRAAMRNALFVPKSLPPLDAEVHGRFHPEPGIVAERVTYNTLLGLRVPAILYLPEQRKGKIPAFIVVNGHGGDKYAWYAFASGIIYARAGAAVLTYDPIGEGERNMERKSGTRAHDVRQDPPELGRRMGGLMMTDVMQAVSYLASRPEVDAGRIAAGGYSMGSFVLSLACAVETRLHACVLNGGGNLDGEDGYWDRSKPMCQGLPYRAMSFLGDRPAAIYALHAARGATLIYNGLQDTTVQIPTHGPDFFADLHRRVVALRGSDKGVFEYEFTTGAHRPYFVTKPVAQWLHRQLAFPNWTDEKLAALATTHQSEWAQANGVAVDKMYATEEREGGAQMVGTEIPALSREMLSVFTPEEWEKQKDRLIYEAWLKAVRSLK